ncbi:hypothetical protein L0P02_13300, partial [Bifidobacterium longum]|nr:hypothetical protein [Bifidobacterium longum]
PAPALATRPDDPSTAKLERIDRMDRWGGIASITGLQLRETSAQLGEWDLAATLLRVSLQNGAVRFAVPPTAYLGIV